MLELRQPLAEGEVLLTHELLLELTTRYSEPHRRYHGLRHIGRLFGVARDIDAPLSEAQSLALWFHDAVYEPTSASNEEDSAALARSRLPDHPSLDVICQIVLDTKSHTPSIDASALVLDLDMCGVAEPFEVFIADTHDIRQEFAFLDDATWAMGRSAFLETCLEKADRGDPRAAPCDRKTDPRPASQR